MRWVCLQLPLLALELRQLSGTEAPPAVILATHHQQLRVWRANLAARKQGVRAGQTLGTAQALCADLHTAPRQPDAEQQAQTAVATLAYRFSSEIALTQDGAVLLEVERSLYLFGGLSRLLRRLEKACRKLGFRAHLQAGWGATAALLLSDLPAFWQDDRETSAPALRARLHAAPLQCLRRDRRCPPAWRHHAGQIGLHRLGELMALPAAGLGRRFGPELLDYFARLRAEKPDKLPRFELPEQFDRALELNSEISEAERLIFPAQRLLRELEHYLRARQQSCQTLHWQLAHADRSHSQFQVGAAQGCWRSEDWRELLRLRLENLKWTAPVRDLRLQVSQFQPLAAAASQLFADTETGRQDENRLCNLLRARLGEQALSYPQHIASPWPEQAGTLGTTAQSLPENAAPLAARPLLLLDAPQALPSHRGQPCFRGPLRLEPRFERIAPEWQAQTEPDPLRQSWRDYVVARNAQGERFWLFRDPRQPEQWFLHGLFGA